MKENQQIMPNKRWLGESPWECQRLPKSIRPVAITEQVNATVASTIEGNFNYMAKQNAPSEMGMGKYLSNRHCI